MLSPCGNTVQNACDEPVEHVREQAIRKWNLGNWSATAVDTHWAIKEHVAKTHRLSTLVDNHKVTGLADAEIRRLRDLVLSGAFSWDDMSATETGDIRPGELLARVGKSAQST